jgi:hypothetical protein
LKSKWLKTGLKWTHWSCQVPSKISSQPKMILERHATRVMWLGAKTVVNAQENRSVTMPVMVVTS